MARRLRHAYILALSIIAVTTLAAFTIEHRMMLAFERSSVALDTVSQQRTLSQKVALFSADMVHAHNDAVRQMAADNVMRTYMDMVEAHVGLMQRIGDVDGEGRLSPALRDIFLETPYALDAKITRYGDRIEALLASEGNARKARYNAVYFETIGPLGDALDAAFTQLEDDAMADVAAMRRTRAVLTIVVMLTLAAEWLFIFRPLARTVEIKTQALREARDTVAHAALHDPLTDLPNRRLLDQILATTKAQAARKDERLAVCHIDLDWFKQINDTLGHSVGDEVLLHAARILRQATRSSDFIARVGGDEFVVVDCTFGGEDGLRVMADRIVERMARPFEIDGHVCRIGASIGIASCTSADDDLEALMSRADIALYHAKELGRGRVCSYSDAAQDAFDDRRTQTAA